MGITLENGVIVNTEKVETAEFVTVSSAETAEGIARDSRHKSVKQTIENEFFTLMSVKNGLTVENIPNAILAITVAGIAFDVILYVMDTITPLPVVISCLPLAVLGIIAYCVKVYLDLKNDDSTVYCE